MAQLKQRYRDVAVYYNVLPFPVLTNNLKDLRSKYRYSEVLLVDTRLREYRRQFLYFLRHQTTSSSSSSSSSSSAAATSSSSSSSSSSNGAVEHIISGGGGKKRRTSNGNEGKDSGDMGDGISVAATTFPSICDDDKVAREFMTSNIVYTRLKNGTKLSEMVTKLRARVGLPLDIGKK